MASSSSKKISESRSSSPQIKPKTMAIPSDSFEVQSESPVDFASLRRNGMILEPLIFVQEMFPYFDMLNGPTYVTLVKNFWARAEVYDLEAALSEEDDIVIRNPALRGKTREEMGLNEGEKNHKKGGLNCVFGNFFFYVLDNCPQVQSLK